MTYSLAIAGVEAPVPCGAGVTILDACLGAGVAFPYNCRSGECGECRAVLRAGTVDERPGADPAMFGDADRARGEILACMCAPTSDLSIEVALRDEGAPAIGVHDAMVTEVRALGTGAVRVVLQTDHPLDYRAGQYFEWQAPGVSGRRSFSAAAMPGARAIPFDVRLYPGGRISAMLQRGELGVGDLVELHGPYGRFGLGQGDDRPAILVAGGTGLAPLKAMLEQAFAERRRRSFRLFHGAATPAELYDGELLAVWAAAHRNFTYHVAAVAADAGFAGERGTVVDALRRRVHDGFGAEAWLCGPPGMVKAATAALLDIGVEPEDIRHDSFVPSA